jgi:hypothetical protein
MQERQLRLRAVASTALNIYVIWTGHCHVVILYPVNIESRSGAVVVSWSSCIYGTQYLRDIDWPLPCGHSILHKY